MKNLLFVFFAALSFTIMSCGEGTPAVELSEEMKDFTSMIKGKSAEVEAALVKYAANDEVKDNDMSMYNLETPKVVSKDGDCYMAEFKAGMTTRTYNICWEGGKISKIEDKGMK